MNSLAFASATSSLRPVRVASVRKPARAARSKSRPATLAPSAGGRVEAVLMGVTFLALAGLAVAMEAVGVATALIG